MLGRKATFYEFGIGTFFEHGADVGESWVEGVLEQPMYCFIISVNTFQIRPKKTEFQKPFGLISIQTEVTHEKSRQLAQKNHKGDLLMYCG